MSDYCCSYHAELRAVADCHLCGRPLCSACAVPDEHGLVACPDGCDRLSPALLSGLIHPIREGARLWRRTVPALISTVVLPMSCVGLVLLLIEAQVGREQEGWFGVAVLVVIAYTVVVTSVVQTGQLIGTGQMGHRYAIRRLVPWIGTVALMVVITLLGYLAFVIPGIFLALRLFWADELALSHGKGPFKALAESWQLTGDWGAGEIVRFQLLLGVAQLPVAIVAVVVLTTTFELLDGLPASFATVSMIVTALVFTAVAVLTYAFSHACELSFFYAILTAQQRPELVAIDAKVQDAVIAAVTADDDNPPGLHRCPHCRQLYNPSDYNPDLETIHCSSCKGVVPRPDER